MKKIAIVTGSARGIGREIAFTLAENGFDVCVNFKSDSSEAFAKEVCEKIKKSGQNAVYYKADVGNFEQAKALVDFCVSTLGKPSVLVNNAGISMIKPLNDVSPSEWNNIIKSDLDSIYNVTRNVMDCMISEKYGKIINIASMWGRTGASCEVAYSAAKAGVIGFTKALAKELAPSNICVNAISPGVILTDMMNGFTQEELNALKEEIPLGKFGTPRDIAELCVFLASEKADYITGQNFGVDGGMVI